MTLWLGVLTFLFMKSFRRHLPTILIAMVTAAITAGGPAIAATIADYATNADMVDKKHAVGAGAKPADRAGKLVATNSVGRLPNNIIAKAPDSSRLGGLLPSAFLPATGKAADADLLDGLDSTGFLGAGAKAADADLLDGMDSTAFAASVHDHNSLYWTKPESDGRYLAKFGKAADADRLDGFDSTDFLSRTGKAADADRIDGHDGTDLVLGGGRLLANRIVESDNQPSTILNIPFMGVLRTDGCDGTNGRIVFDTMGTGLVDLRIDTGDALESWTTSHYTSANRPQAFWHLQVARHTDGNTRMATIVLTWRASDCTFAAQALAYPQL